VRILAKAAMTGQLSRILDSSSTRTDGAVLGQLTSGKGDGSLRGYWTPRAGEIGAPGGAQAGSDLTTGGLGAALGGY
jgi:hypothetical protein